MDLDLYLNPGAFLYFDGFGFYSLYLTGFELN